MRRNVICCVIMMALLFAQALPVNAMTVYESDGIYHDEGYIFVGESHAVKSAIAFGDKASVLGNSLLLGNGETLTYELRWDERGGDAGGRCQHLYDERKSVFCI